MAGIIWLASFPKSGNTWLRAFLANYLSDGRVPVAINTLPDFAYGDMRAEYYRQVAGRADFDPTPAAVAALRPRVHRFLAESRPGAVFVKTHNALASVEGVPLITPAVTFAALYVVRDPRDVAVSFAHHYGVSLDDAVRSLNFSGLEIEPKADQVRQYLSDWSAHVNSWRRAPGLRLLLVRYEDLLASPQSHFGGVLDFLGIKKERERLKRAIRHASFRVLAAQESEGGFVERSRHADRFFRKGGAGGWRDALSPAQAQALVDRHGATMRELGYATAGER